MCRFIGSKIRQVACLCLFFDSSYPQFSKIKKRVRSIFGTTFTQSLHYYWITFYSVYTSACFHHLGRYDYGRLHKTLTLDSEAIYTSYEGFHSMPTENECPDKYEWWINELNSLGIKINDKEQPKDIHELENLTDDLKQRLIQRYKGRYNG